MDNNLLSNDNFRTHDDFTCRFRVLTRERGLGLGEVAKLVSCHKETVRGWQNGRKKPHPSTSFALESALNKIPTLKDIVDVLTKLEKDQ